MSKTAGSKLYHPPQRNIKSRIMTRAGWITGTLTIPATAYLADYLNRGAAFDTLVDVSAEEFFGRTDFLMLNRSSMILLVPEEDNELQYQPPGESVKHSIILLMEEGSLQGEIDTIKGIRVSDFFLNRHGFVPLRSCRFKPSSRFDPQGREVTCERLVVHSDRVLGVTESVS